MMDELWCHTCGKPITEPEADDMFCSRICMRDVNHQTRRALPSTVEHAVEVRGLSDVDAHIRHIELYGDTNSKWYKQLRRDQKCIRAQGKNKK